MTKYDLQEVVKAREESLDFVVSEFRGKYGDYFISEIDDKAYHLLARAFCIWAYLKGTLERM
jgi:hypothetical protein